jgi:hyperosmotically inducible protein
MRNNFLLLALLAVAGATGCTPREQQRAVDTAEKTLDKAGNAATKALDKTTDVVSDVSVTGAIKARYAATRGVPATAIDVTTKNNVVTLTGKVQNAAQRNEAIRIAKATPGAKQVINKLTVGK